MTDFAAVMKDEYEARQERVSNNSIKFRKKPIEIEARQLTFENYAELAKWCGSTRSYSKPPMRAVSGMVVPTLEGEHVASFGDWIIRGVKGEFYPCKPEIFELTYEKVI